MVSMSGNQFVNDTKKVERLLIPGGSLNLVVFNLRVVQVRADLP